MPITIGGITFEHPLMNAAGECKDVQGRNGIEDIARSAAAAVVAGSFTLEKRPGNPGETYWSGPQFAVNARGLPNPGLETGTSERILAEGMRICREAGKPFIVSIAGFNPEEYRKLATTVNDLSLLDRALVEINLGCPNVKRGDGRQKPAATYDLDDVFAVLDAVEQSVRHRLSFSIKLSPVFDPEYLEDLAIAIQSFPWIDAVVTSNTVPNVYQSVQGKPVLSGNGFGGMSGPSLKPVAIGQVRQLRALLPEKIAIIGVGGISTGQDALDYLAAGATLIQIGTHFFDHGAKVFGEILAEMIDLGWEPGD